MVRLITKGIPNRYAYRMKHKEKAADCIFLTVDRICQNNKSIYYGDKCFIASQCTYKVKSKDSQKYIDGLLEKQKNEKAVFFKGVHWINIEKIIVERLFEKPSEEYINSLVNEYQTTKAIFDKVVVISFKGDKYYLEGKYAYFCAAKRLGTKSVRAVILTQSERSLERRLRRVGEIAVHKKLGKCQIKRVKDSIIVAELETNHVVELDIYTCIQEKLFVSVGNLLLK